MVDLQSLDLILMAALAIVGIVIFLKIMKYLFLIAIAAGVYLAWKLGLFKAIGIG